jgi:acyl-CoA thioester hydrolase
MKSMPRQRGDFRYFTKITTRWSDNDMYGHVNNVVYLAFFDAAVNRFLIEEAGMTPLASPVVGLVVETGCAYFSALSYPQLVDVGVMAAKIGTSSVRYEIGIFAEGASESAAHGHFVHVYVDAHTRRPVPVPQGLRAALTHIVA